MRKFIAELIGTALLVFFGAGAATLSFGFRLAGYSTAAGIVATALTFGLILMALVVVIGPISGCHVNPAVTMGALVAGRLNLIEAVEYWIAQFVGGILGALLLWAVVSQSPFYSRSVIGLGADGYGSASILRVGWGGAFLAEVILTAVFTLVVLVATSKVGTLTIAAITIGLSLTVVHLVGIAIDGTSVNPARSLGPALILGGTALNQVWLFIVAPLVGGIIGAGISYLIYPRRVVAGLEPEPSPVPASSVAPATTPAASAEAESPARDTARDRQDRPTE